MKRYSHLITIVGGILAFFGFALPWENDNSSGALLANSGAGTLITILFIIGLTIICFSFSLLNRYTEWHLLSKIAALIISGLSLLFFSIVVAPLYYLLFLLVLVQIGQLTIQVEINPEG